MNTKKTGDPKMDAINEINSQAQQVVEAHEGTLTSENLWQTILRLFPDMAPGRRAAVSNRVDAITGKFTGKIGYGDGDYEGEEL